VIRVVSFLPEDLDLVKRGPSERRDLLDDLSVQLWPAAHLDQREYERALRQRNAFLRSGDTDPVTLGVWDSRLAQAGGKVLARRVLSTWTLRLPVTGTSISMVRVRSPETMPDLITAAAAPSATRSWSGALRNDRSVER